MMPYQSGTLAKGTKFIENHGPESMSALSDLLNTFRQAAVSEREKGTYFEELIVAYLRNEATYRDLYSDVWTYADWAAEHGKDGRDVGIDLVAKTADTNEFHAIQCKFFAEDYCVTRGDLDSFFTASGKKPFVQRVIVTTTDNWNEHAKDALQDQTPPCITINLYDLEASQIDWAAYRPKKSIPLKGKKSLRDHQIRALSAVSEGFKDEERGKLIMACGTGKTFTSLKIAEQQAGAGKQVLFLVPSLALLSQTLTEWTQESDTPMHSFAVCSDSDVGKKRRKDDDVVQTFIHELRYPATTDPKHLANAIAARHDNEHMSVVFSTYHSIDVIHRAQHKFGLPAFDLIICDEAHRTTGQTFDDEDESNFVRIHDADYVRGAKRLYMTATPRIYGESAKGTAEQNNITLCSMDDSRLFGKELFVLTFNEAVKNELLVDYKVLVLAMDEKHVSARLQRLLADEDNQVKVEDAAKIIGCWKALSKQDTQEDLVDDHAPMKRAVAFCQVIEYQAGAKTHKISSKKIASMFQAVVEEYKATNPDTGTAATLNCEAEHIDGSMSASEKEAQLNWLKSEVADNTCRVLSNVRCLSEGVDVPSLDAVLFLTPRNSQVDVVQSVGRVMRRAPGKKRGYVVLPVVIPSDLTPEEALNDNKTYKVVWQVLQALRSHDDRFDAMINKLELNGPDKSRMEVIAVTDKLKTKSDKPRGANGAGRGTDVLGKPGPSKKRDKDVQEKLQFEIGEIERAIYAKVVQKCGNRSHWEDWAVDIAKIAKTHIARIEAILENPANTVERAAFEGFTKELRTDLNDGLTDGEIVEMLAQHLITRPVFDALFAGYSFAQHNPMSRAMQAVLDALQKQHLDKEADTLQKFYESVKLKAEGITNPVGRQKIVVELYDKFFSKAFPRLRDTLGIVYTPVEVVDFILRSVNDVLQNEFEQTLGADGIHIIDPFTGTGTFITRLLQSGLLTPKEIQKKYRDQIHANELVLLAYYIAAINIESAYHEAIGGDYVPFEGICLTDTFQMTETEGLLDKLLVDNNARRRRQKKLDIRVIIGNPPYYSGDKDDTGSKKIEYPALDQRIAETHLARSERNAGKSKSYDSFKRAIRWASDRIGNSGVIGFVTGAGFLESSTDDGLRRCLTEEFASIYIFHLRGNARTSGELRRKEKDNVFGVGSRAPIAVSLLVKNPKALEQGKIYFHDIGDYLTREEKLEKISQYGSIAGLTAANAWQRIIPDAHGDWLKQRNEGFEKFIRFGKKENDSSPAIISPYSMGVKSNRDDWVYSSSRSELMLRIENLINFYNSEVVRFQASDKAIPVEQFVNRDKTKIKWTSDVLGDVGKGRQYSVEPGDFTVSLFRPFNKQWLYSNKQWNWSRHLMPRVFPNTKAENLAIQINDHFAGPGFIALMTDTLPDFHCNGDSQCFPLYLYEELSQKELKQEGKQAAFFSNSSFADGPVSLKRRDGITDTGLAHFRAAYPSTEISKEDLFYYVYGLLHSPDYLECYADNLSKELPRIPCVKTSQDFWAFSKAGRELAGLHIDYEEVPMYAGAKVIGGSLPTDYRVEKMRYGKNGKQEDKTTLLYNGKVTVTGIPLEAYEYVVNGKSALDWVVERQCVKTDKESGIVNDANNWASETMNNPKYPLQLFLRVVTVSLETMKIVRSLPKLVLMDESVGTLS